MSQSPSTSPKISSNAQLPRPIAVSTASSNVGSMAGPSNLPVSYQHPSQSMVSLRPPSFQASPHFSGHPYSQSIFPQYGSSLPGVPPQGAFPYGVPPLWYPRPLVPYAGSPQANCYYDNDSKKHSWTEMKTDKMSNGKRKSDYDRVVDFLIMNNGENLKRFKGSGKDGKTSGVSKGRVASECVKYFEKRGITYRSKESLRKAMSDLTRKMYKNAHQMFSQSGEGSLNGDSQDLKNRLEEECPGFTEFKRILRDKGKDSGGKGDISTSIDLSFMDKKRHLDDDDGDDDDDVSVEVFECDDGNAAANEHKTRTTTTIAATGITASDPRLQRGKRSRESEYEKDIVKAMENTLGAIADKGDEFLEHKLECLDRQAKAQEMKCQKELRLGTYRTKLESALAIAKALNQSEEQIEQKIKDLNEEFRDVI
ncbi:hypothetical protein MBANPS3_007220 [Mucor bainieri]